MVETGLNSPLLGLQIKNFLPPFSGEAGSGSVIANTRYSLERFKDQTTMVLDHQNTTCPINFKPGVHVSPGWQGHQLVGITQLAPDAELSARFSTTCDVQIARALLYSPWGIESHKVVIKPSDNVKTAVNEINTNCVAQSRGVDTTDPMFLIIDKPLSFIVTAFEEGATSLDKEDWSAYHTHPIMRDYLSTRLGGVADILAYMHYQGVENGDAQLRNFMVTERGKIKAFDWECSTLYPQSYHPTALYDMASNDLGKLFLSLTGYYSKVFSEVVLRGNDQEQWDQYYQVIVKRYISSLKNRFHSSGRLDYETEVTIDNLPDDLKAEMGITKTSVSQNYFDSLR